MSDGGGWWVVVGDGGGWWVMMSDGGGWWTVGLQAVVRQYPHLLY